MFIIKQTRRFFFQVGFVLALILFSFTEAHGLQLHLLDGDNNPVDPLRVEAKATVFFFIRSDCPISNRYAPEIARLNEKFAPQSIKFWLVYPDADETITTIRQHLNAYAYTLQALRDPGHQLVKLARVRVTPEVAVFVNGKRIVYRGRIDDRFAALGKMRAAPTTHDLEDILQAIVTGKPIKPRSTAAVGCFISDLQ